MNAAADPALVAELRRSLRDEIGARELYARIAARESDPALEHILAALGGESPRLIEVLRGVLGGLGVDADERDWRRSASAALVSWLALLGARRLVLRLCLESEEALARRYAACAHGLAASDRAAARACEALAGRKSARARSLQAWVPR